jgi:hypothetical protein
MPENLLRALQFLVVLVLYLFFARVLRAVWTELHPPKLVVAAPPPAAPAAQAAPVGPPPLAAPGPARPVAPAPVVTVGPANHVTAVEPPPLRGSTWPVSGELIIGRAPGSGIALTEPTVSSTHARLFRQGGQVLVEDLGSRNGTFVNRQRINGARPLQAGDRVGIGPVVVLEVGS